MIDPWSAGDAWFGPRDNLAKPQGVVYQGNRTTNKTGITTTETGVMRLDSMSLLSGRSYWIVAQNTRIAVSGTVAATDHYVFRLRANTAGAAADTSSTEIGRAEITTGASTSSNDTAGPLAGWINPASSLTASVILTFVRTTGAATPTVQGSDPGGIWLTVFDMGLAVTNTAVIL